MTRPTVEIEELDNQLGVADDQQGDLLAIVATASDGPLATPGLYSNGPDVSATFGHGLLVELGRYAIDQGLRVLLVRQEATTDGVHNGLDTSGVEGSSTITIDGSVDPWDDYQIVVEIVEAAENGTTIGVAGIKYRCSLDGGQNFLRGIKALGTANTITIAEANVKFNLGAGDLKVGDKWTSVATAPAGDDTTQDDALLALEKHAIRHQLICVEGPHDASSVANMQTRAESMMRKGRRVTMFGSFRWRNAGETEQQYLAAYTATFDSVVAKHCCVPYDAIDVQSPVTQQRYRRRAAFDMCVAAAQVRPGEDLADVSNGARPAAVSIVSEQGNPKYHDENQNPGADDARASTYCKHETKRGTFICNARILSDAGSDVEFVQHRRVLNMVGTIVRRELLEFSSSDIVVSRATGFILEEEAQRIDTVINAALETEVTGTRNASGVTFKLNRSDNILSTKTLNGATEIDPLAYPKHIKATLGFHNPALRVRAAEEG